MIADLAVEPSRPRVRRWRAADATAPPPRRGRDRDAAASCSSSRTSSPSSASAPGLTALRLAFAGRFEPAAALIIFAALLDGLDGLIARRLNAASRFGAELDSLSDFVNFGVVPALLVYELALAGAPDITWTAALVFAVCACLRLARFNVNRDAPVIGTVALRRRAGPGRARSSACCRPIVTFAGIADAARPALARRRLARRRRHC